MLIGTANTLEFFAGTGFEWWVIYYKGTEKDGRPLFRFDEDENATPTEALDRLRKVLGMLDRGSYSIMAMPKGKGSGRGAHKINFDISAVSNNSGVGAMPIPAVAGLTVEDVQREAAKLLDTYKNQLKVEALEKENADLKKQLKGAESGSGIGSVMQHLGPHVPALLSQLLGTPAGIAGLPQPAQMQPATHPANAYQQAEVIEGEESGIELTDDQHARLSNVVSVFIAARPNEWLELLEKIAAKVQQNPGIIDTLKMFL